MTTRYEIRRWSRLSLTTFIGQLFVDGKYDCDITLATTRVTESHDRFVLQDLTHSYILMKYEKKGGI